MREWKERAAFDPRPNSDMRPEKMMQRSSRDDVEYWGEA